MSTHAGNGYAKGAFRRREIVVKQQPKPRNPISGQQLPRSHQDFWRNLFASLRHSWPGKPRLYLKGRRGSSLLSISHQTLPSVPSVTLYNNGEFLSSSKSDYPCGVTLISTSTADRGEYRQAAGAVRSEGLAYATACASRFLRQPGYARTVAR